ncbi:FecR family protein [bacterium A37T11]|nr:FecR family protein [bacterium A37T11]
MEDTRYIAQLLSKHLLDELTNDEKAELEQWAASNPVFRQYVEDVKNGDRILTDVAAFQQLELSDSQDYLTTLKQRVHEKITAIPQPTKYRQKRYLVLVSIAALFIVAVATTLYFYHSLIVNRTSTIVNEIAPGYNQATLTLANGKTIKLDSAQSGIIVQDEDIKYNDGSKLPAVILPAPSAVSGSEETSLPTSLTLSTPKGGQYQIILSDGTKVRLNAASTLKYPSRFSGDTREVFLEGEAFFEVNNNPSPFIVHTNHQTITVLGTKFIVTAYADENVQTTTLVSGAVKVNGPRREALMLSPGEQGLLIGDQLTKVNVDIKNEIAWTQGIFSFKKEPLENIMKKLARWYDVDVTFENQALKQITFEGSLERSSSMHTVLRLFEHTGEAHFRIAGRRVSVY